MSTRHRVLVIVLYALAVMASGILRYTTQDGGEKGLYFGLVMGGLALLGAGLVRKGSGRLGMTIAISCVLLVGGWFGYEALVKKGFAAAEVRQLVILGLSIVALVLLLKPADATRHPA